MVKLGLRTAGSVRFRVKRKGKKTRTALIRRVNRIEAQLNSETHEYSPAQAAVNIQDTGVVILKTGVAQGLTTGRVGRSIGINRISVKGYLTQQATSPPFSITRLMWFIDKQSNGVLPTEAELFNTALGTRPLFKFNKDNRKRFVVLKDMTVFFPAGITGERQIHPILWSKKIAKRNRQCKFDTDTATQADCVSNHIYLYQTNNLSAADSTQISEMTTIYFVDN